MATLRPVDSYVADLITALRKAFKVTQNMTQTEALRQKRNMRLLMRNDQFVGKRKLKDHLGDEVYTVCNHIDVDVPVYIIKNQQGRRQTLHQN